MRLNMAPFIAYLVS